LRILLLRVVRMRESPSPDRQRCEAFLYRKNWGFSIREYMKKSQIPTNH
jgi:hypothetical protein